MNPKLEEIALQGTWLRREDRSMGQEMKDDLVGERTRYAFYCPYCDREFVTQKEYRVTDNYITDSIKTGIFWRISEFFWDTLGAIPIIGYYLRRRADDRLERFEDKLEDRKDSKTLIKAFQDVQGNFIRCKRCGKYTCTECMVDGICGFCRDTAKSAGGQATGASRAGGELAAEYDKQIEELEKMHADLIARTPSQKEMLEQQLEEQKKQLRAAQKQALEGGDDDSDW